MAELRTTTEDQAPVYLYSAASDLGASLNSTEKQAPLAATPVPAPNAASATGSQGESPELQQAIEQLKSMDPERRERLLAELDPATRNAVRQLLANVS